jgi:hypothetical protein
MGCITSRGDWPPKPNKRVVVRNWYLFDDTSSVAQQCAHSYSCTTEEDYVIDWPGLSCRGTASGAGVLDAEHDEQIGGWANIVRNMEEG